MWVALGDSLTYGFPFSPRQSWVARVEEVLGVTIINRGVCGDTLAEMAARLEQDVLALRPDRCLLLGGTNDVYQVRYRFQGSCRALIDIVEQLRQHSIEPVIGLPLPVEEREIRVRLEKLLAWVQDFCREEGLLLIDFYSAFMRKGGTVLLPDGVHPGREGYQLMAETALAVLLPAMEKKEDTGR